MIKTTCAKEEGGRGGGGNRTKTTLKKKKRKKREKGRMLRSEGGDGGCCGRGRIIIWLPLRLSHYSLVVVFFFFFFFHFAPLRWFESSAREVNILNANQSRFFISDFFLFCWAATPPHGAAYNRTTPALALSLSLSRLHFFLSAPVIMGWPGGVQQGGGGGFGWVWI